MPFLTTCCCGFSVRTGTKAIAVLSLVYSVLGLLMVGTFKIERDRLVGPRHKQKPWENSYTEYSLHNIHREMEAGLPTLTPRTVIFSTPEAETEFPPELIDKAQGARTEQDKRKAARLELIMTVYAVSVSVNFLVSLSLLAGVRLGQRWLLVPWISWNVLSLLVSQMAVFYAPNKEMTTIPDLFSTVISVYCILCVVSYFQELTAQPPSSRQERHPVWNECDSSRSLPDLGSEPRDSTAHLSPRRPHLIVALPPAPDMGPPPAYPATEAPPVYDPPPPYPGSPEGKVKEEVNDEEGSKEGKTSRE